MTRIRLIPWQPIRDIPVIRGQNSHNRFSDPWSKPNLFGRERDRGREATFGPRPGSKPFLTLTTDITDDTDKTDPSAAHP